MWDPAQVDLGTLSPRRATLEDPGPKAALELGVLSADEPVRDRVLLPVDRRAVEFGAQKNPAMGYVAPQPANRGDDLGVVGDPKLVASMFTTDGEGGPAVLCPNHRQRLGLLVRP